MQAQQGTCLQTVPAPIRYHSYRFFPGRGGLECSDRDPSGIRRVRVTGQKPKSTVGCATEYLRASSYIDRTRGTIYSVSYATYHCRTGTEVFGFAREARHYHIAVHSERVVSVARTNSV